MLSIRFEALAGNALIYMGFFVENPLNPRFANEGFLDVFRSQLETCQSATPMSRFAPSNDLGASLLKIAAAVNNISPKVRYQALTCFEVVASLWPCQYNQDAVAAIKAAPESLAAKAELPFAGFGLHLLQWGASSHPDEKIRAVAKAAKKDLKLVSGVANFSNYRKKRVQPLKPACG